MATVCTHDQRQTFTDRREAIALFNLLRGRDPREPRSLLPILTFIAPSGSGKSTLIDFLREEKCRADDTPALPYAHLDFSLPHTPRDILHILVALRNQLQRHLDGSGRNLSFPRFDLGAAIILATPADDSQPRANTKDLEHLLTEGAPLFHSLHRSHVQLEEIVPYIPAVLDALTWAADIKPLISVLARLEREPGWQWYRDHTYDLGLRNARSVEDVLLRLSLLCQPERPERDYLVEEVLSAALITDLLDTLVTPPDRSSRAWDKTTNAVIFFDGFETLQHEPDNRAARLLDVLALAEQRLRCPEDPILLVIATRKRLRLAGEIEQEPAFEEQLVPILARRYALRRLEEWEALLPAEKSALRLSQLYLPIWLYDFCPKDARDYLTKLDAQRGSAVFADEEVVDAIYQLACGHPIYLALVAAAAQEAAARGGALTLADLEPPLASGAVVPAQGGEQLTIALIDLFLRQLPQEEQRQLICCAAPRALDVGTLRAILQLASDSEAHERWERYRRLPFMRAIDAEQIAFHPLVRTLLLRRLTPDRAPQSAYHQTHTRLRAYFVQRASTVSASGEGITREQAQIEAAYHALALGQPELAIALAFAAQNSQIAYWSPLMETVALAPSDLAPIGIDQRAFEAVNRARQHRDLHDTVTGLVLCRWLLTSCAKNKLKVARLRYNLALAYSALVGGDRPANLKRSIFYYQAALKFYQAMSMDFDSERARKSLEIAQDELRALAAEQGKGRERVSVAPGR